jgi:hypothetical protein
MEDAMAMGKVKPSQLMNRSPLMPLVNVELH